MIRYGVCMADSENKASRKKDLNRRQLMTHESLYMEFVNEGGK